MRGPSLDKTSHSLLTCFQGHHLAEGSAGPFAQFPALEKGGSACLLLHFSSGYSLSFTVSPQADLESVFPNHLSPLIVSKTWLQFSDQLPKTESYDTPWETLTIFPLPCWLAIHSVHRGCDPSHPARNVHFFYPVSITL